MRIAKRIAEARESGTARIARITGELEAAGQRILKLNVGEPDFNTPEFIAEAARRAIAAGKTRYTDVAGTRELREAVAQKFRSENAIHCSADSVIVGTGAKQLIFNALLSTVEPGDEVIIPTPSWVSYPDIVTIAGGSPVLLLCSEGTGFKLTAEAAAAAVTGRTRWIVLNSPCNPTGAVYTADELRQLAELVRRHPGIAVMADDIYEKITFGDVRFSTMAELAPDLSERILTVNGVSKSHAMTGWRIGFAAGPADLISAMAKLQSQSTTNPSSIGQAAALAALTDLQQSQNFIAACRAAYQTRRDRLHAALAAIPGLRPHLPDGAFYSFVGCDRLYGKQTPDGKTLRDDAALCEYLLREHRISVVPGAEFGASGFFRMSFAASGAVLAEACVRLQAAVAGLR